MTAQLMLLSSKIFAAFKHSDVTAPEENIATSDPSFKIFDLPISKL